MSPCMTEAVPGDPLGPLPAAPAGAPDVLFTVLVSRLGDGYKVGITNHETKATFTQEFAGPEARMLEMYLGSFQ